MKKLLLLIGIVSLANLVNAQMFEKQFRAQYSGLMGNGQKRTPEFKESVRKEKILQRGTGNHTGRLNESEQNEFMMEHRVHFSVWKEKLTMTEKQKAGKDRRPGFEEDKKKKVEGFDFTAGAIFSTKTGEYPKYNPLLGLLFGVQTQLLPLSDDIGLGLGVLYSMQGGKHESSDYVPGGNYNTTTTTSRLNYLNFPLVAKYQKEETGFFAEAGIQPGILLSAKEKGETTTDIKEDLRKFDLGIPIGIGYRFKNKIGVGMRVIPGLMNVNKDEQYENKNMVASLR
ncbi:MAG: porin family protein, partial [Flavisolibacter sp.]